MGSAIIAIQRYEPYLMHWLDYHLNKFNFSHIVLFDNNDVGDELQLPKFYNEWVTVIPINDYDTIYKPFSIQESLYDMGYNYLRSMDISNILIIDIDEYFYSEKYQSLETLIAAPQNNSKSHIYNIPYQLYGDSGKVYMNELLYNNPIDNYTIPGIPCTDESKGKSCVNLACDWGFKFGIHRHQIDPVYCRDHNIQFGNLNFYIDKDDAIIKHYRTGCVEAYIEKIRLRRVSDSNVSNYGNNLVSMYFRNNFVTHKKLDAFEELFAKYNIKMSDDDKRYIEKCRQALQNSNAY